MIKLELQGGYCHTCPNFEAEVEKPAVTFVGGRAYVYDAITRIRCEHRNICGNIANHIELAIRKEYEDHV